MTAAKNMENLMAKFILRKAGFGNVSMALGNSSSELYPLTAQQKICNVKNSDRESMWEQLLKSEAARNND